NCSPGRVTALTVFDPGGQSLSDALAARSTFVTLMSRPGTVADCPAATGETATASNPDATHANRYLAISRQFISPDERARAADRAATAYATCERSGCCRTRALPSAA